MIQYETKRLILREWQDSDFDEYLVWFTNRSF